MKIFSSGLVFAALAVCLLMVGGCKKEYIHVGENWDAIHNLKKPEKTFSVTATGSDSAAVGKELKYSVTSAKNGRLWVVQVDPEDEVSLLFPNDLDPDNSIKAEMPLTIPPQGASWAIEASEPKGESVVVFVVTTGDVDIDDVLATEQSMAKAIRIVEGSPSWGFAKKVIEIR